MGSQRIAFRSRRARIEHNVASYAPARVFRHQRGTEGASSTDRTLTTDLRLSAGCCCRTRRRTSATGDFGSGWTILRHQPPVAALWTFPEPNRRLRIVVAFIRVSRGRRANNGLTPPAFVMCSTRSGVSFWASHFASDAARHFRPAAFLLGPRASRCLWSAWRRSSAPEEAGDALARLAALFAAVLRQRAHVAFALRIHGVSGGLIR